MATGGVLTNFPNGVTSFGVPLVGGVGGIPLTGNWYFVNPTTGSDGNTGGAGDPFATLAFAYSKTVSGNNDVVVITGTNNLTSTLNWSNNNTHLIGMGATNRRGKSTGITGTGTAFTPMVNVSGTGCYFVNFKAVYGFNSASNNAVCWTDTGGRNSYTNVEFIGFANGTASTGTANITSARALVINNALGETSFYGCNFGTDAQSRNATNYTLEIAGAAPRLFFSDCVFEASLGSSGAAAAHLLIGASGIAGYTEFSRCRFYNDVKAGATAMTQLLSINSSIGGMIVMDLCTGVGFTHIETTPSNQVFVNNFAPSTVADVGIAVNNHSS